MQRRTRWRGSTWCPGRWREGKSWAGLHSTFIGHRSGGIRHEVGEFFPLLGGKPQTELRAPPEHIVGGHGPFVGHEIAHFGFRQVSAEAQAKVFELLGLAQDTVDARAIGKREAT